MRLAGKTAIVTGAGSGFGQGIAQTFAREGAKVVLADVNLDAANTVALQITQADGQAVAVQCDVSKAADWGALMRDTLAAFGAVHIIINNAGTTHKNQPLLNVDEAEFDRVYAVNVKSIYLSAMQFVPYFRQHGGGVFINIASTAGVRPRPGLTWYNGSKGAVIITSKSMAAELGADKIRANCVNPVIGESAMTHLFMGMDDTPENRAKFTAGIPLGRFSRPQDVANACLYLASDEAEFITGACLEVDGGRCV
jgi:3-oxoacyl-[acyl-carrier protein] reductase